MAPRYMHSQQFADLPAEERAAHHVTALHDHEVGALAEIHGRTHFDDLPWRRRRIEGHALRAVVAMLEAFGDRPRRLADEMPWIDNGEALR